MANTIDFLEKINPKIAIVNWAKSEHACRSIQHLKNQLPVSFSTDPSFPSNRHSWQTNRVQKKGPSNDQTQSRYTFSAQLARRQVSQVSQGGEGLASSMHGPSKTATSGVGCGLCLRASYMYTRRWQWHTLSGRYTRAAPLHVAMPVAGHGSAVRHVAGMIGRHGA